MLRWRLLLAAVLFLPSAAATQQRDSADKTAPAKKPDRETHRWKMLHANELQTPWTTFRVGGAVLPEMASFSQNANSRIQVTQMGPPAPDPAPDDPADSRSPSSRRTVAAWGTARSVTNADSGELPLVGRLRDSRVLVSGKLATERNVAWSSGIMYDWPAHKWRIRQTGFLIDAPEIYSNFWVGRTKEGPSLNRVTSGYDTWMMERFTFSDAAIPLLADGIRWQGYMPKYHLIWNLGGFTDRMSRGESFSSFSQQAAGRIGYVKMASDTAGNLFHVALAFQFGSPTHDTLQLKSKPEAFETPLFINTGKFPATASQFGGVEIYRRTGSWLYGTEYYVERATSPQTNNPVFSGGDVFVTWLMTGETRRYIAPGSVFAAVTPKRSVFDGGYGAVEWLLRLSNIDLNGGTLKGGTFWRVTPGVSWYVSDNVRFEMNYGYGRLTRFGTTGVTQFFQYRLQLQL